MQFAPNAKEEHAAHPEGEVRNMQFAPKGLENMSAQGRAKAAS